VFRTVRYGDICVCYETDLDGGGTTFGQDYVVAVRERFGRVGHAFEFCAGPGFIGFSLLAHGLCDRLTLADVSPAAVRACEETIRRNHLEDRVRVYRSDCLDDIPADERWDLVVGNPPHFDGSEDDYRSAIRLIDPNWTIHRKLYRDVAAHLRPGGRVMLQENGHASRPEDFAEMIAGSGLEIVRVSGDVIGAPPSALERWLHRRVLRKVELLLMSPRVERLVKDSALYRRVSSSRALTPSPFYFLEVRAA
jgi:methylase of polypeptide subunit release factors